jgi:predicted DNA-binding ribbon-helix-helix protein
MCRIYAGTARTEYEPVTRSLRLHGAVTSIRLEARFWAILDEMAEAEGLATPKFLTKLHDEVLELHGEVRNFTSLLRVACAVYLDGRRAPLPTRHRAAFDRDPTAAVAVVA